MKLIVAGGRDFTNTSYMQQSLSSITFPFEPDEQITLVCGMARGADITAHKLWLSLSFPIIEMPADWNRHGRSAGFIRNSQMAVKADALVAFWDQKSRGTEHMINTMKKFSKPVWVFHY